MQAVLGSYGATAGAQGHAGPCACAGYTEYAILKIWRYAVRRGGGVGRLDRSA